MPKYSVMIQYDEEDHIYVASIPELKGCMAHGETPAEAMKEVYTVMDAWLDIAEEKGLEIPPPVVYASEALI